MLATDALNATICGAVAAVAATGADITFVPVDFSGHAIGDAGTPWLNAPGMPDMLHPNAAGYAAYAAAVAAAIHPKMEKAEHEKPEMVKHRS